jgi:hypothetical protein
LLPACIAQEVVALPQSPRREEVRDDTVDGFFCQFVSDVVAFREKADYISGG